MDRRLVKNPLPAVPGESPDRLSVLFDAHGDRLYRLARRLAATADDALDLVQDTFLKAAQSTASIPRGKRQEEAWLVRVLVNVRRDQWRKESVRKRHEFELSLATIQHDDPEAALLTRATVWKALDRLPPRRRAVVVMHEIEGLSIASIATLLGISGITVRWHLSRGRRELARRLRLHSGETDEQTAQSLAGRGPVSSRSAAP
jgi:RNA polymerase sigma-70 factor (ECF subfamily)